MGASKFPSPYRARVRAGYSGFKMVEAGQTSPVTSFNTRTGAVTLTSLDVTDALTFTPASLGPNAFGGNQSITGGVDVTVSYTVNGVKVVGSSQVGWTAPTGVATRTTFDTTTVTTADLAERVKALIDDLTTHGLIGT